ncbi:unnamed protein product [Oikopleura dioica]|uniref:Uncharacterized protein n=1 Tax=Oikopleura dioica TaxID=34765 RepID=E4Y943_OIKDI|nr:unnamed protein product [Oikopleura dioica]
MAIRVETLSQKVKSLNPKTSAKLQNTPRRVVSSPPFRSPSHVERRLFAVKGRPQSVVRLQSKLNLDEDPLLQPFEIRNGRSGSMIRPRSLESDILLLSLPRKPQSNSPLTQLIINHPSTRQSESLPSPIFGPCAASDQPDPRTIRRTNTTATCGAAQIPSNTRLLLDSDASTSPERSKTGSHSVSDIHGFGDTRLALVRRSMIARRTQQRLREKRRRNRTVALSPEDDRRSSFISTFLDQKSLEDRSTQIPSQPSTLSKEAEETENPPQKLKDLNSTLTISPVQNERALSLNLALENNESSSGYWTGGSTIHTLPDRCVQELSDQNLMKHNSRFTSSSHEPRILSPLFTKSDFSGTDSEPLLFARPKPPPPSRSDSIPNSHSDSQPQSPSPELIIRPSTLVGLSDSYLSAVNSCELSVLTPSDASESGISSNLEQFAFPSPPKNISKSPERSALPVATGNSMQDELAARLFHRRSKIERIENGEEAAFEKPARTFSSPEPSQISMSPVSSPRKVSPKKIIFEAATSSPSKSDSTIEEDSIEITVIENPCRALSDTSETEPLPKPEDDEVFERTSSPASLSPIRSSSVSPGRRSRPPAGLGLGLRATQSLSSRGRSDSRRAKNLLTKNNTANFKSLLLQNISTSFSPKRRNKSKNRFNTAHRLTSIVEEKDLQAAKEFYQNNYCNANGDNCTKTDVCTAAPPNECTSTEQNTDDQTT